MANQAGPCGQTPTFRPAFVDAALSLASLLSVDREICPDALRLDIIGAR